MRRRAATGRTTSNSAQASVGWTCGMALATRFLDLKISPATDVSTCLVFRGVLGFLNKSELLKDFHISVQNFKWWTKRGQPPAGARQLH